MRLGVGAAIVAGELVPGDVAVDDGTVSAVGLGGAGGEHVALPGLVDLQVNGYAGVDLLAEPGRADEVADALAAGGVTSWQPTLITSPVDRLRAATAALDGAPGSVGVHLEGPFLSPRRAGAHPPARILGPDLEVLGSLLDAGPVSTVTLAPELPGALDLVDLLVARGVRVSLGHSDATAAEAEAAFDRGAATVTHLFNAMRPFAHRDPGIAGAALAREDVAVQLIADGVHLADESVLVAWRAARGRVALVSDAIAAAGLGDGSYRISEVDVLVENGVCRTPDGILAGSVTPLLDGFRNLCRLGVPLAEAADAVTRVPASIVGRPDLGLLRPGTAADLVVLDDSLELVRVLRSGALVA
jgi:N-acetylglucosamine-6-phosphate deacetylase